MIDDLLASLQLKETGPGLFHASAEENATHRQVVFGGELLGQAIVASSRLMPAKRVKSVQTIFMRGVQTGAGVEIRVEPMHEGRNLGSTTVTFSQSDRPCVRCIVLHDVPEADLVRHQPPMPVVAPPDQLAATSHALAAPETIIVDDVDVQDPDLVGPAILRLWVRFPGTPPGDSTLARALLAHATDGWLIATAMRPHAGLGQSMAHVDISTGVVSHALVFHDDFDTTEWLLIDHQSIFAGSGRCYGTANIFSETGGLVASFSQEALLRRFPAGQGPRNREKTVF
jgi:acyl-CoA thioesterase II